VAKHKEKTSIVEYRVKEGLFFGSCPSSVKEGGEYLVSPLLLAHRASRISEGRGACMQVRGRFFVDIIAHEDL